MACAYIESELVTRRGRGFEAADGVGEELLCLMLNDIISIARARMSEH